MVQYDPAVDDLIHQQHAPRQLLIRRRNAHEGPYGNDQALLSGACVPESGTIGPQLCHRARRIGVFEPGVLMELLHRGQRIVTTWVECIAWAPPGTLQYPVEIVEPTIRDRI